jgi:hypothetical protein
MTCAEAKEAFNHVLDMVLDRGDSSSLKRSLIEDGITDIFDLITVTVSYIVHPGGLEPPACAFLPLREYLGSTGLVYHIWISTTYLIKLILGYYE